MLVADDPGQWALLIDRSSRLVPLLQVLDDEWDAIRAGYADPAASPRQGTGGMERPHRHCSHIPARLGRRPVSDGLGRCRQGLDYSLAESLETQLGGKFRDQVGLGTKQRVPLDPAGEGHQFGVRVVADVPPPR